jgi:quercetin dioxygenase-like cupin family protein
MWITRADKKDRRPPDRPQDFSGPVRFQVLHRASDPHDLDALIVSFEPGARTRPHIHTTMQVLHVIEGEGVVATGDERRLVRPGAIVIVPAGEWHWHGATPQSAMSHISVRPPGPTDWNAPVRDWESYMEGAHA